MKKTLVISFLFLLVSGFVRGQEGVSADKKDAVYTVKRGSLDADWNFTSFIACSRMGRRVLGITEEQQNTAARLDGGYAGRYIPHKLAIVERLDSLERDTIDFDKRILGFFGKSADIGSIIYSISDEAFYLSAAKEGSGTKSNVKLYKMEYRRGTLMAPRVLSIVKSGYNYAHPWISQDGENLFFASNLPGSIDGSMDIFMCNRIKKGAWSNPIHLGDSVNTAGTEVFPTYFNRVLYYSSDGKDGAGGLDIFYATQKSQFSEVKAMPAPLNSKKDDFQMIWANTEKGLFTSSRQNDRDFVYGFQKQVPPKSKKSVDGFVQAAGTALQDVEVKLFNEIGELVGLARTDSLGKFSFGDVAMNGTYAMKMVGVPRDIMAETVLSLTNAEGKVYKELKMNKDGEFVFQFLDPDLVGVPDMLVFEDESLLTIDVEGQIFDEEPGDIGAGEAVRITDTQGELLGLTYTDEDGTFSFENVTPYEVYEFKTKTGGKKRFVVVNENGVNRVIPMDSSGRAKYQRIAEGEGISLFNEKQQYITVKKEDLFELSNIQYDYDSAALKEAAKTQLDRLGFILELNPKIFIALNSHTDCRGPADYNNDLSQRRADGCAAYLVKKGISASRLEASGFGESQLLNDCKEDEDCPEEQHAINRRTEIQLIVD